MKKFEIPVILVVLTLATASSALWLFNHSLADTSLFALGGYFLVAATASFLVSLLGRLVRNTFIYGFWTVGFAMSVFGAIAAFASVVRAHLALGG